MFQLPKARLLDNLLKNRSPLFTLNVILKTNPHNVRAKKSSEGNDLFTLSALTTSDTLHFSTTLLFHNSSIKELHKKLHWRSVADVQYNCVIAWCNDAVMMLYRKRRYMRGRRPSLLDKAAWMCS